MHPRTALCRRLRTLIHRAGQSRSRQLARINVNSDPFLVCWLLAHCPSQLLVRPCIGWAIDGLSFGLSIPDFQRQSTEFSGRRTLDEGYPLIEFPAFSFSFSPQRVGPADGTLCNCTLPSIHNTCRLKMSIGHAGPAMDKQLGST